MPKLSCCWYLIKFGTHGCHELAQDLLKLEAVQKEVAHYNGGEPTFGQWAAAAGTDENTLRKRLSYGIYCKNTMVKSNVRLVISIAKEFEGPRTEFSDLIQVTFRQKSS
jgi:DNA-directed RNA polymerase sigma subunit (sigma70/sigma32)